MGRLLGLTLVPVALFAAASPAHAQGGGCAREAASIRRAETQLPRLEVAPPNDQQIVCITLETNILYAKAARGPSEALPAFAAGPRR